MNFKDFMIKEPVAPELIGGIIPKNRFTLLHGPQGSGKTYSVIKMLNAEGIIPLYIDFDHSDGIDKLQFYRLSKNLLNFLLSPNEETDFAELKGEVVILDTYTRIHEELKHSGLTDAEILTAFEYLVETYDITLIVIGHTRLFVGKDGIFQDNTFLTRGASEELFLEKTEYKKTKNAEAYIEYALHVQKGRGTGGARIIQNWMREPIGNTSKVSQQQLDTLQADVEDIDNSTIPQLPNQATEGSTHLSLTQQLLAGENLHAALERTLYNTALEAMVKRENKDNCYPTKRRMEYYETLHIDMNKRMESKLDERIDDMLEQQTEELEK